LSSGFLKFKCRITFLSVYDGLAARIAVMAGPIDDKKVLFGDQRTIKQDLSGFILASVAAVTATGDRSGCVSNLGTGLAAPIDKKF
jgi:hypothetical protein